MDQLVRIERSVHHAAASGPRCCPRSQRVSGFGVAPVQALHLKPAAEPECAPECEPECAPECEPEFDDVRAEYQSLHHKTRKKVARELGGGDGMNTADADAFVLSLPDDALDELRRVIDGAK